MRIGYARVSTIEQHEERQLVELQEKADVERTFRLDITGCLTLSEGNAVHDVAGT